MEKRVTELKPFPEVRVVDKLLDKSWAAQYRERARPPRIEFGPPVLEMTKGEQMVAIYHEMGHWFRCEHLPRPKNGKKGEEAFADAFAEFMIHPARMKRHDPVAHAEMEMLIRPMHRRKMQSFAKKMLRKL